MWLLAMANIAIPSMGVMCRVLLLHVSRASTNFSMHRVRVEPMFCVDFWDRGCACTRGGGVRKNPPGFTGKH